VAAGEQLSTEDRVRLERAVSRAEDQTGLQLCVYLGPADGQTRQHAEQLLAAASARSRPAVMLYVAPEARKVECVVAPGLTDRISDAAAQQAVDAMLPLLAAGDLAGGLEVGLERLAEAAGPPRGDESPEELPDVLS
jgi:uncharacterized membrane protein YgcG